MSLNHTFRAALLACVMLPMVVATAREAAVQFTMNARFIEPAPGSETIGPTHGDVAVAENGEIYVSVQWGAHPGIQVFSPQGHYLRNVPDAPNDLHAFVIAKAPGAGPRLFGVRLAGQEVLVMELDGRVVLRIPGSAIPDRYKSLKNGGLSLHLTGIAVSARGDIYVVDGYGRDFIHRFDASGRYLGTFGGRGKPWEFEECHKIAIDVRFRPERLLCADRLSGRIVQMDLEGHVLGTMATGLRRPSAFAIYRDELAVAELGGRVSILDKNGAPIAQLGSNDEPDQIKTDQVPPSQWDDGRFYAPHGIAYDAEGNLYVTEWSQWGRVVRLERRVSQ